MTQYEEFMMQDDTVFVITFTDMSCEQLYFKGTPENIASYLLRWGFGAGITITDKRGRTILASNGSYIRECDDPKLMNEVYHWILNYRDETDPVIFEAYYLGEDNCGEVTLVPSTCITREDEETYTLWNIGLPLHVVQQFQSRTLHSDVPIHKLLGWIPKAGTGYNREVAMMVLRLGTPDPGYPNIVMSLPSKTKTPISAVFYQPNASPSSDFACFPYCLSVPGSPCLTPRTPCGLPSCPEPPLVCVHS